MNRPNDDPAGLSVDAFVGEFLVDEIGQFDFALRATADGGISWTYCDRGGAGSNNGYRIADAGQLTSDQAAPMVERMAPKPMSIAEVNCVMPVVPGLAALWLKTVKVYRVTLSPKPVERRFAMIS